MLAFCAPSAFAQDPALVKKGGEIYAERCRTCHGPGMRNPEWGAIDLHTFPKDQPGRFVDSVTNGKNTMPAWGDVLSKDDIAALWAYVSSAGDK